MKVSRMPQVVLTLLLMSATSASARTEPVPISPGQESGIARIATRCPTFSWSVVPGAPGYELVVYRLDRQAEPIAPDILKKLPAGVSSWTPALDECLAADRRYAWSIRSLSPDSEWSTPSLFSVADESAAESLVGSADNRVTAVAESDALAAEGFEPDSADESVAEPAEASTPREVTSSGVAIAESGITIGGFEVVTSATDQDTLGAISCPPGFLLVQSTSGWGCLAPTDLPVCSPNDFIYCFGGDPALIGTGVCRAGTRFCNATGTGFEACVGEVPPSAEICDELDNDCDGSVDEDASDQLSWFPDGDGDGFGDAEPVVVACAGPAGWVTDNTDCDDTEGTIFPGAVELCDGLDNDCDSETLVDEACGGYCTPTELACLDSCSAGCGTDPTCIDACPTTCGAASPCAAAVDAWFACRLTNFAECVAAAEIVCPACRQEYLNVFGPQCVTEGEQRSCGSTDVGACQYGSETCSLFVWGACEGAVEPVSEQCDDAIDNDCDGSTDESGRLWWPDLDEDGWPLGDPIDSCTQPEKYVDVNPALGADCDDSRSDVYPFAPELCDGVDNDCDGQIDEDATAEVCDGVDNDCDGAIDEDNPGGGVSCDTGLSGVCSAGTSSCSEGSLICIQDVGSSTEVCDGADNDCDGVIDDGNPGGGAACDTGNPGVCAAGTETCQGGTIACVQNEGSSDEICDGLDNDCNDFVDEGDACLGQACTENSSCGDGNFCQKSEGDCSGSGSCAARPFECSPVFVPVCGCDGSTYPNSCEAAAAGVNISSSGECLPPP